MITVLNLNFFITVFYFFFIVNRYGYFSKNRYEKVRIFPILGGEGEGIPKTPQKRTRLAKFQFYHQL